MTYSSCELFETVVTPDELQERVNEVSDILLTKFEDPLFVCALRGGAPLTSMIIAAASQQRPDYHPQVEYMRVHTPGIDRDTKTPAVLHGINPKSHQKGQPVVLIDDLLNTGLTAQICLDYFKNHIDNECPFVVVPVVEKSGGNKRYAGDIVSCFTLPSDEIYVGCGMEVSHNGVPEAFRYYKGIMRKLGKISLV